MATFDKAVRYEVTAVTETPLRTPSDGSIDRVLRHRDGTGIPAGCFSGRCIARLAGKAG